MKEKHTYIIRNCAGKFWTGSNWSAEYPDAKVFTSEKVAITVLDFNRKKSHQGFMSASVWMDYGFDSEIEVAS